MTVPATAGVAAFDFDGTLSHHDSLVPFLVRVCGPVPVSTAAIAEARVLLAAATGRGSRDLAKEAFVGRLLAGRSSTSLQEPARRYAAHLVRARLRVDTVERLRWHLRQGHTVVIVSASPELYLGPVGEALGASEVLATRLEVNGDGRLTGRFDGANVRGPEKARRLRAWLDACGASRLWAYGDSDGDTEMLAMADVPLRVGHRRVPPWRWL